MQFRILYYEPRYEAFPWPFRKSWARVVRGHADLPHACEDFGVVSPTDYSSEIPSVPAHLPRGLPIGNYEVGIYHDAEYLYAILDVREGPAVVTPAMFRRQRQVPRTRTAVPVFILLTADRQHFYRFGLDDENRPQATVQSARHGPRRADPPELSCEWDCIQRLRPNGERTGWRLRRETLAEVFAGASVQLSVSRACYRSHEYAAWGGGHMWGPRPDEMITVDLVTEHTVPPCPVCRRLDMMYDPNAETGRFRLYWRDLYGRDEIVEDKVQSHRAIRSYDCSFRFNSRQQRLPLRDEVDTEACAVPDGYNFVEASTAGEQSLRLYLEKRSGNRIAPCPVRVPPPLSRETLLSRIREETDVVYADFEKDGPPRRPTELITPLLYRAASAGRVYAWLDPDPRLKEILRVTADAALALQREDGTYRGCQMAKLRGLDEMPRWSGGAFDTGPAGELWAVAASLLGDDKYLDASRRLVQAYEQYRIEFNHNYAAFTLYHLSAHYRLTREPLALEHGLYYATNMAASNILPLGFQPGHNFYTVYGFITLRALANFCQVLPDDNRNRPYLRERCLRMANQLISRLQPDGSFDSRDRYFMGERIFISGLFSVAPLLEGDNLKALDDSLQGILRCPRTARNFTLIESEIARYLALRERLLGGEEVDLLAML